MGLTDIEKEIILVYAECSMNATDTGRTLFMHRTTIQWHFQRIKAKTGLEPRRFYDLVNLAEMAKE